jgi:hypothetical protein
MTRSVSLPDVTVQVAPGASGSGVGPPATASASPADESGWIRVPGVQGAVRPWALAAAAFALLWLVTFMWGLHRRPQAPSQAEASRSTPPPKPGNGADLRRALDNGDLGDVSDALCAMATPPVDDVDALRSRLADPEQLAALESLLRARWGGGDGVAARAQLRSAFKQGPRWRTVEPPAEEPLPPLYPRK